MADVLLGNWSSRLALEEYAVTSAGWGRGVGRRHPGTARHNGRAPRPSGNEPRCCLPEGAGLLEADAYIGAASQVGLPQSRTVGQIAPLFLPFVLLTDCLSIFLKVIKKDL